MGKENSLTPESLVKPEQSDLIRSVIDFQVQIRDEVREQLLKQLFDQLSEVVDEEGAGDITYKIDAHTEEFVLQLGIELAKKEPLTIVSEGIGRETFGDKVPELEIIVDPIDGTREIMYDKRSAWILTGIAFGKGGKANLSNIEIAVQTEIPTTRQNIGSIVYAVRGRGAYEELWNLETEELINRRKLESSQAVDIRHGYIVFADLFRGSKVEISQLAEAVLTGVLGEVQENEASAFNDQYTSSAWQLYLLASGRYRFVADLRPEVEKIINKKDRKLGISAHPYDLATILIAEEAGGIITNARGEPLSYPFDTETNCTFIGYANKEIQAQIEPVLLKELQKIK